jgi:formylglycine-generating enzyme required for sulfatase activity
MNDIHSQKSGIQPTSFKPSPESSRTIRPSVWQVALTVTAILVASIFWFLFTSKSVQLEFTPSADRVVIEGGLSFELAGVWLLREGSYQIRAEADLHELLVTDLVVGGQRNQQFQLNLTPLPGELTVTSKPDDATIDIDGDVGPIRTLSSGTHLVTVSHPLYQSQATTVTIEGKRIEQILDIQLSPNWADVAITSTPAGANIVIDSVLWPARSPTTIQALAGEREIEVALAGYKTHRQRIFSRAGQEIELAPISLIQADAQIQLTSSPANVGVLVNGQFQGKTPILLDVRSDTAHRVQLVLAGYEEFRARISVPRGDKARRDITLRRQTGTVNVAVEPARAEIRINGTLQQADQNNFRLPISAHNFEISLPGYAAYSQSITPRSGLTQEIKVRLLTFEEARLAALKPSITAPDGQSLKLFKPSSLTLGASRREPGRRANETLRRADLSRLFYLATHETTNAQFRQFASGHDSGKYVETSLNDDDQPVANLSWHDAAAYCNWLSEKAQVTPFYEIEYGKVASVNHKAKGYRLPTEAEWSWVARAPLVPQDTLLRFPWGDSLPPPDRHGNYADRAASTLVGRIIFGYNDNYPAASPVGSYKANLRGLFDIGGNIAEWTNDFYEIPSQETVSDPWGPKNGAYHVIKGASWMHGSVTELRYSFRDYAIDGRQDVGFRIARSAE